MVMTVAGVDGGGDDRCGDDDHGCASEASTATDPPPCTHPLAFLLQTRGRRYLINFIRIGTLVLFVHDVPDIFAYAIKFVVDTGNAPLILTFYFALLAVWGYVRLFVFPVWRVRRVWVEGGGAGKGER